MVGVWVSGWVGEWVRGYVWVVDVFCNFVFWIVVLPPLDHGAAAYEASTHVLL